MAKPFDGNTPASKLSELSHSCSPPYKGGGEQTASAQPFISGPAGVAYCDYNQAAKQYIQTWLPEWRRRHYMLPSVFEYKFTEPSDRASGAVRGVGPDCEDRSMDIVYHAVNRFMREYRIPGIVLCSFTMHRRRELLERFLPFMTGPDWVDQYADIECDLLIVSPKMGFVAFEVKGTQSRTTETLKKQLQKAALRQASAKLMKPFLQMLAKNAGFEPGALPVWRVVALPFQRRTRFANGGKALSELLKKVEDEVESCLFEDDFVCNQESPDEPTQLGIDSCLEQFVLPSQYSRTAATIPEFQHLMETLIAVWALRSCDSDFVLDPQFSSASHAIAKIDLRLKEQSWFEKKPNRRSRETTALENNANNRGEKSHDDGEQAKEQNSRGESKKQKNKKETNGTQSEKSDGPKTGIIPSDSDSVMMADPENRIFFITPEQQKVLDGPRIQLIHGAAGTGKSVLIMIKAAQLIKDGQRVAIFACWSMVHKYKLWKERSGFDDQRCGVYDLNNIGELLESLKCEPLYDQTKEAMEKMHEELRKNSVLSPSTACRAEVKCIVDQVRKTALSDDHPAVNALFAGSSVFLDDAISRTTVIDDRALLYLAISNTQDHCFWLALDVLQSGTAIPVGSTAQYRFDVAMSLAALLLGELPSEEAGTLSVLRSVQRCSRHVFKAWFDQCSNIMDDREGPSFAKELYRGLVPGHHFPGPDVVKLKVSQAVEAVKFVSKEISTLVAGGTRKRDIAILCDLGLRIESVQQSLEKENTSVAYCDFEHQLEHHSTDAVAVGLSVQAVSLEWPIVFVMYPSSTDWVGELPMAMSRARTKLTVVEVDRVEDEFLSEEARKISLEAKASREKTQNLVVVFVL